MISVKDKVVLVTGASRGIGKSIALLFAVNQAKVVICSRNKKDLELVSRQAEKLRGGCFPVICDVTLEKDVKNLVRQTLKKFKKIDILINNAGLGIHKPVVDFTTRDWDTTIDTNLKGVFLCSREILPYMIKQKSGQIINIGSLAGKNPIANLAVYCASKFGLIGFSESLGLEVRNYNIKVNLLLPGTVDTSFGGRTPQARAGLRPKNALLPQEVAEAVLALATQEPYAWSSEMNIRPLVIEK